MMTAHGSHLLTEQTLQLIYALCCRLLMCSDYGAREIIRLDYIGLD